MTYIVGGIPLAIALVVGVLLSGLSLNSSLEALVVNIIFKKNITAIER